ncbi:MAG TPA: Error-prone repair protein ImuA [Flavipsychrobacter sp.]
MDMLAQKESIIRKLQNEALSLQRRKGLTAEQIPDMGLGPLTSAFPGKVFPLGAVHELISDRSESAAATNGFLAALLGKLSNTGYCLWVSNKRTIFPSALKQFGIDPHRIIFIDLRQQKDVLWAVEEALKCDILSAVVGELSELSFTESRRLQLAVEQSGVTGFIHRHRPRSMNTVACVTRWKITPVAGNVEDNMPGVGFPLWNVELLKVRNGKPGTWDIEWRNGSFRHCTGDASALPGIQVLKTG